MKTTHNSFVDQLNKDREKLRANSENIALIINKIPKITIKNDEFKFNLKENFSQKELEKNTKKINQIYLNYLERFQEMLDWLTKTELYKIELFKARLVSRLAIHLGDANVYKTSILLNRNYILPFIPGSSIKGMLRHYCVEYEIFDEKDLTEIFGSSVNKKKMGRIIFFDALINIKNMSQPIFDLDVMSIHYEKYYSGNAKKLEETENPNIVFFLTTRRNIEFIFSLADRMANNDDNLLKKVSDVLKEALENWGIGAKTFVGYGRFEVIK